MMKKETLIISIAVFLLVAGIIITYFVFPPESEKKTDGIEVSQQEGTQCLKENEIPMYGVEKRKNEVSVADIIIADRKSNQEKYRFQIELPIPNHYHPVELHKCGVYATRSFNYDYKKTQALADYRIELWRYKYNGEGGSLIFLSGPISGSGFSTDFRIDLNEKYIILEKSYLGKDDYALVVKDLNTKEDIFVLPMKDIISRYPNIVGNFGLDRWTNDGRYFWGDIFDGAYSVAYFRIDTKNWEHDIFEAPDGSMGGMSLNINTGYLPLQPGLIWTGDLELTEDFKEQDRKEGKKSSLYLYNVFTKEKILIETIDEPQFFFKPQWISDTELQYEMPGGEKRIYKTTTVHEMFSLLDDIAKNTRIQFSKAEWQSDILTASFEAKGIINNSYFKIQGYLQSVGFVEDLSHAAGGSGSIGYQSVFKKGTILCLISIKPLSEIGTSDFTYSGKDDVFVSCTTSG